MKKNILLSLLVICGIGCYWYFFTIKKQIETVTINKNKTPKRRKFLWNKLWRDKAAERLEQQDGAIIHRITLNDEQYKEQLGLKLIEEASEVHAAKTTEDLTNEIGDVLEVVDCIMKFHNISVEVVTATRDKKRDERGSFLERQFVTVSEYLPGSFGEQYTLKDPRYVEIFDEA